MLAAEQLGLWQVAKPLIVRISHAVRNIKKCKKIKKLLENFESSRKILKVVSKILKAVAEFKNPI